jgi:thiol-disulfide isomerase/thioredoxin
MMSPVASRSRSAFIPFIVLIAPTLLLAGCASWSGSTAQTRQAADPQASGGPPGPAYAFSYPAEPPVLGAKELRAFAAKFRPRVVLLDFWASWCRQSREEMPDLVKLQEELGTDDFQVISCNLDAAPKWAAETVPFLRSQQANFPCVVLRAEAKGPLRDWLAPGWSHDLPARFILDSRGRVVGQALSGVAVADVQDQVRSLVLGSGEGSGEARLAADGVGLRVKLIDVRRGQSQSLPELLANTSNSQTLATQACRLLAAEIDRRLNVRIAILPFPSSRNRAKAGTFGYEMAEQLRQDLRRQGYYDLVGPDQTEKMIAASGLTALSIDYEPAVVKDRLNCDFLVLGWLRGEYPVDRTNPEATTEGGSPDHPGETTVADQPEEPQE